MTLIAFTVAALGLLLAGADAGYLLTQYPNSKTVANKVIVTWTIIPGGGGKGFFELSRTKEGALEDGFSLFQDRTSIDNTKVYCKYGYHVCPMYDAQGSIAGLMVSAKASDLASAPYKIDNEPHWFRQNQYWTVENEVIYSTVTYFDDPLVIAKGGRILKEDDLTAPNGIYILQTKDNVASTLHVPREESDASSAAFTEQSCFLGMGKHYFQELTPSTKCDSTRPYFTLYGHQTKTMHGYGVLMWGKQTNEEDVQFFEQPNSFAVKLIAGNRPDCLTDWVDKYTLNSVHVFFIPKAWETSCSTLF